MSLQAQCWHVKTAGRAVHHAAALPAWAFIESTMETGYFVMPPYTTAHATHGNLSGNFKSETVQSFLQHGLAPAHAGLCKDDALSDGLFWWLGSGV